MRRSTMLAVTGVATLVVLTGCAQDEPVEERASSPGASDSTPVAQPSVSETPSATPKEDGTVVDISVQGEQISPLAERVPASVGEPVTFNVVSDRPGELHVHSDPEQTLSFTKGNTVLEVVIERPGVVEVEEHETGKLIVQLEVR